MDFNLPEKLSDYIWINGNMIPWDDANIHVLTHSLHYSGAVFEGERAYDGKIFKLIVVAVHAKGMQTLYLNN